MIYRYCKQCGRIAFEFNDTYKCPFCQFQMIEVPTSYLAYGGFLYEGGKKKVFHDFIKNSPEFNKELYNQRIIERKEYDKECRQKAEEIRAKMPKSKSYSPTLVTPTQTCTPTTSYTAPSNIYVPKCPTCGSPKVHKISTGAKVVNGALFGIFSSDVRNTFVCDNCGYKW